MRYTIIFFLLFSMAGFSQKTYTFDYRLTYEQTTKADTIPKKVFYYISSSENSYNLKVSELDSLQYKLYFVDGNGIVFQVYAKKSDFKQALSLNTSCDYVTPYDNPYKSAIKNYDYYKLKDTILKGKKFSHYVYRAINPRKEKRKKWQRLHYVIDTEFSEVKPLFQYATAYEEWKINHFLPNGIVKELYYTTPKGEVRGDFKLVERAKTDFKINIPKDCDYTKKQ